MTRPRSLLAVATGFVALAVVLSGCAGSPAPDPTVGEDSPLIRYLGALSSDDGSDAQRAAQSARVQAAIATCMAAEGFEYLPESDDEPYYRPGEWQPDDAEWVAQWGYGLVDFPGKAEMIAAQAAGNENTAYLDSLSASEHSAYSNVLYGPQLTDEQIAASLDGSAPVTWEQQGCWGKGHHEVEGENTLETPAYESLREAITAFRSTQFEAPDYAEVNADWSDCMAAAGHGGFDRQPDAAQSISTAMESISYSQAEYDRDDPRFDDLHDEEVELALADLACRNETDYRARSLKIQYAQEEQFIADHEAELEAALADADQGR